MQTVNCSYCRVPDNCQPSTLNALIQIHLDEEVVVSRKIIKNEWFWFFKYQNPDQQYENEFPSDISYQNTEKGCELRPWQTYPLSNDW